MGRAERRANERLQRLADREALERAAKRYEADMKRTGVYDPNKAATDTFYMAQVVAGRVEQHRQWDRNGITEDDLKKEYKRGYDTAQNELTAYTMRFFYCAGAIAAHRLFGFGEGRIMRLLDEIQRIMTEELSTYDIIERCEKETGLKIFDTDYE